MRIRKPRNTTWLVAGIFGLSGLAWFTNTFPPDSWWKIILFFTIVFASSFCTLRFVLNNVRRTILISCGVITFFLLQLLGLHQFIFSLLLIASLVALELLFAKN